MADTAVEQYRLEGRPAGEGTAEEAGLKAISTVANILTSNGITSLVSHKEEITNGYDLNNNGDMDISDILKFEDILTNLVETTNGGKNEIVHERHEEEEEETGGESSGSVVGEVIEEEIVELEFEKVKPKLHTHSLHCPNCKAEVTKVILRRKVLNYRPVVQKPAVVVEQPQPDDLHLKDQLVGCFSCLSLFTYSDNGRFNPFDIFRKRPDTVTDAPTPPSNGAENAKLVVREKDNCLSMFWVFGKGQKDVKPELEADPSSQPADDREFSDQVQPKSVSGTASIAKGQLPSSAEKYGVTGQLPSSSNAEGYGATSINKFADQLHSSYNAEGNGATENTTSSIGGAKEGIPDASLLPSSELPQSSNAEGDGHVTLDLGTGTEITNTGRIRLGYEGIFLEILKSIVYGGLMEVIASLSVVASAAASDAATLSIVALASATLIGGVLIIAHNLWDLRDDCHKESSTEVTNNEATNKYTEVLGRVEYFPLHAFFAILSFLVFGMVPPIAYGYSLHETNDKDYTLVVVSVVSLLCVSLLALFKAYINKCAVMGYFKTVAYYLTTAVSVSGVSYVVGNLVTRLMEEYGLFDTSPGGGGVALLPRATTLSLASF